MFKQIFWVGIGVGIGVLAVRKASDVRRDVSAEGLNRTVARFADGLHEMADAFRAGMSVREGELRTALGLEGQGPETNRAGRHV